MHEKSLSVFISFLPLSVQKLITGCRQVMVMNVHACSHDAFNYLFNHVYQLVTDFVRYFFDHSSRCDYLPL